MNFRNLTCGGLVVATLAIVAQIVGGADYPTIPPGPIILTVLAVLVLVVRRWWILGVVAVLNLMLLVGGIASPNVGDNLDAGGIGRAGGTVVQLVAMVFTVVVALLAIRQERRAVAA